jgi:restriction endonuclease Mrr
MFPKHEEIVDPLLSFIFLNGGPKHEVPAADVYQPLAAFFGLTKTEQTQPRKDGHSGRQWDNQLQWARQRLINRGLAESGGHGIWRLTAAGVRRAIEISSNYPSFKP